MGDIYDKIKISKIELFINDEEWSAIDQVMDVGVRRAASILADPTSFDKPLAGYIAIGSGTTEPSSGDEAMEVEEFRKVATVTCVENTYIVQAEFGIDEPTDSVWIREVGILSELSGGVLVARWSLVDEIYKENEDNITIRCIITLT